MTPIGRTTWVIPEGYLPSEQASRHDSRELVSHEAVCLLNTGDADAHVRITAYFTDREPVGPYQVMVPARRTRHVRFNELSEPEPIPPETDYSTVLVSDVPVVAQHTRLDSRDPSVALMTTVAFPVS